MADYSLPTYQQATGGAPISPQRGHLLPTLVLQGSKISSVEKPQNTLYELSSAPAEVATHKYDIYKTCQNPEQTGRSRRLHIYTFTIKTSFSLLSNRQQVVIQGKSKREGTCQQVTLTTKSSRWDNCSVQGLFTASTSKLDRLKNFSGLTWLDTRGNIIALESQVAAEDGYLANTESRLNTQEALTAAELDLLIACWMARFVMDMKCRVQASRPSASTQTTVGDDHEQGIELSDVSAVLVISETSLNHVTCQLPKGMKGDIKKFRPNIVVSGAETEFSEDYWRQLDILGNQVLLTRNCNLCVSLNLYYDTDTFATGPEGKVLANLSKDRRVDVTAKYSPIFGRYGFIHKDAHQNSLVVGDKVLVNAKNDERTTFSWLFKVPS